MTIGITTTSPTDIILPPPSEQTTAQPAVMMMEKIMTLLFGAKVTIPFGSTIILLPVSRIEMEQPPAEADDGHTNSTAKNKI